MQYTLWQWDGCKPFLPVQFDRFETASEGAYDAVQAWLLAEDFMNDDGTRNRVFVMKDGHIPDPELPSFKGLGRFEARFPSDNISDVAAMLPCFDGCVGVELLPFKRNICIAYFWICHMRHVHPIKTQLYSMPYVTYSGFQAFAGSDNSTNVAVAQVDLHGCSAKDATRNVYDIVMKHSSAVVCTGRGVHSLGGFSVVRQAVFDLALRNKWEVTRLNDGLFRISA